MVAAIISCRNIIYCMQYLSSFYTQHTVRQSALKTNVNVQVLLPTFPHTCLSLQGPQSVPSNRASTSRPLASPFLYFTVDMTVLLFIKVTIAHLAAKPVGTISSDAVFGCPFVSSLVHDSIHQVTR
jgi:hypothetical protein